MKQFIVLFSLLNILIASCNKDVEFIPNKDGLVVSNLKNFDKQLYSIGQFDGPMTCTATFIQTPNLNLDAPAYVITNGHCVNYNFEDNPIYTSQPIEATITFKKLADIQENNYLRFSCKRIVYSTMKGTDLAIVELNHTNRELINAGLSPIPIADAIPAQGDKIFTYGYPLAFNPSTLRVSTGIQGQKHNVAEFIWLWFDLYSNNMKNISSGSSGSPVFSSLQRGIWGLINTTTSDGVGNCELGAPCEFTQNKIPSTLPNINYVLDVTSLKQCFNKKGLFDLHLESCSLEKPTSFNVSLSNNIRNFDLAHIQKNSLQLVVDNFPNTKYRIDKFEDFDKSASNSFIPITSDSVSVEFPKTEGFYVISVVQNNNIEQAKHLTFKLDFTSPDASLIKLSQTRSSDGGYSIEPIFLYPELVRYQWKVCKNCDCQNEQDYTDFSRISMNIAAEDLPQKVCVQGFDLAGNKSQAKEFVLVK